MGTISLAEAGNEEAGHEGVGTVVELERMRTIKFLVPGFDFVQGFRSTSFQGLLYFSHFENRREGCGNKVGCWAIGAVPRSPCLREANLRSYPPSLYFDAGKKDMIHLLVGSYVQKPDSGFFL